MIEHLEVRPSAYFYLRKGRITSAAITALFQSLRTAAQKPSPNLFRHVRERVNGLIFSAICFSHERVPGFLDPKARKYDRVHGFLMLVERDDYVAVFGSGLDLPANFRSEYLGRANRSRVEGAVASADAIFERIRVKSTSPSKQVLRSKTLEADNLENSMPVASASRYFTQTYSVRRADGHFSATGRHSQGCHSHPLCR